MSLTKVLAFARPLLVGAIATSFAVRFVITGTLPSPGILASTILACGAAFALVALFKGPPSTIGQVLYQTEQDASNTHPPAVRSER